jgi:hypothetical protein
MVYTHSTVFPASNSQPAGDMVQREKNENRRHSGIE